MYQWFRVQADRCLAWSAKSHLTRNVCEGQWYLCVIDWQINQSENYLVRPTCQSNMCGNVRFISFYSDIFHRNVKESKMFDWTTHTLTGSLREQYAHTSNSLIDCFFCIKNPPCTIKGKLRILDIGPRFPVIPVFWMSGETLMKFSRSLYFHTFLMWASFFLLHSASNNARLSKWTSGWIESF